MNRKHLVLVLGSLLALGACGDDGGSNNGTPDGGGNGDGGGGGSCTSAGSISTYPGTYDGDLSAAGAEYTVAEGTCTDERDYFEPVGEDQVVALTGLTGGATYAVKVSAAFDMSFYLVTGCSVATGPSAGECLLFVDESAGTTESADFVAPASGEVFVVVDRWTADPETDLSYTIDVVEAECTMDTDCSGATPYCIDFVCVQCATDFNCTGTSAPVCDGTTNTCIAGYSQCTGDDAGEDANDGPASASTLTVALGSPSVTNAKICSVPAAETDYYKVVLAATGDLGVTLDWAGTEDLDVILFDSTGTDVAFGFFDQPEAIRGNDLPAGTYYIAVSQYEPVDTVAATSYTLTVSIPECSTSFDCKNSASPVCNAAGTCVAGPAQCTGDDAGDPNDDGPAGARSITPTVGGSTTTNAAVCSLPSSESDWYQFTVDAGDSVTLTLDWTDMAQDLDLTVVDSMGVLYGLTYWVKPEVVTLSFLPAGTYYATVNNFAETPAAAATSYSLVATRTAGGCTANADCALTYSTQLYRGTCGGGACSAINGAGALANGLGCDSNDDCTSGLCSYRVFESDAQKSVCTIGCTATSECSTLGTGYACTTPFQDNFCHPTCTSNLECGANPGSGTLDSSQPWDYLTCTAGACAL